MGIRYFHNLEYDHPWSRYHAVNTETGAYAQMDIARGRRANFEDSGRPPRISYLRSDPSMRTSAMFMLTRGVMDHPGVVASGDLSPHSSRLLHRAVSRGIFPDTQVTHRNNLELEEMNMHRGVHEDPYLMDQLVRAHTEIPREDMLAAKQELKRMLLGSGQSRPLRTTQPPIQPHTPPPSLPPHLLAHINSAQFDASDPRYARRAARQMEAVEEEVDYW